MGKGRRIGWRGNSVSRIGRRSRRGASEMGGMLIKKCECGMALKKVDE